MHMHPRTRQQSLHPPVTLQPAVSYAMYDNKHRVWAGADALPPMRRSLNAYESEVESV